MNSHRLGSLRWSKQRGGRLNAFDRFTFLASAIKSRLKRRFAARPGDIPYALLNLDALRFPDSDLVRKAFVIGNEAYEPWLLNHCLRTYLWGGLVGQLEAVPVDLETFLVTSVFHDLGLVNYGKARANCECFAVRGARAAATALAAGAGALVADACEESIAMHLNITVAEAEPALNYLLHQGAGIDVVGWNLYKVRPMVASVLQCHPRLDFKRKFIATLAAEARAHPQGRLAMMTRFGFLDFIERAAYVE